MSRLRAALPLGLILLFAILSPAVARAEENLVVLTEISGIITEGAYENVRDAVQQAEEFGAPLIVLLNTPGGAMDATKKIVELFLNAKTPVVCYVSPYGATAWSAGALTLLSSHVAAMAPGTVIGSAQPVRYDPARGAVPVDDAKIINALVTYFEEVAKLRGRNKTAAKEFVIKNLNLGPEQAVEFHVADLIAHNVGELLRKLDGRVARTVVGEYTLRTTGAKVVRFEYELRTQLMRILEDPAITSLLFTLGIILFFFGIYTGNPGPPVIGVFLMLLSLIGTGFSVNITSAILLILGAILLCAELFTPGFGILGSVGIAMISFGFLLLPIDVGPGRWAIHGIWYEHLRLFAAAALLPLSVFFGIVLFKVIKAKRMKPKLYLSGMVGFEGVTIDDIEPGKSGFIICEGEYWLAESEEKIAKGEKVIVVEKVGVVLKVKKVSKEGGKQPPS